MPDWCSLAAPSLLETRAVTRGRGRPKSDATKEQISVRLDPDVVAKLREAGPGWRSRINTPLRQALGLEAARNRAACDVTGCHPDYGAYH